MGDRSELSLLGRCVAHADDSANTIRMQRQQIDKLKKDNDRLKDDLAIETRQAKQANNLSTSTQIAKLQDQADMYAKKINVENRRIEELDRQIAKLQETIHTQRSVAPHQRCASECQTGSDSFVHVLVGGWEQEGDGWCELQSRQ